jgi:hypothetical protein
LRLNLKLQQAYYQREFIEIGFYDFLHPAHEEFLVTANADLRLLGERWNS